MQFVKNIKNDWCTAGTEKWSFNFRGFKLSDIQNFKNRFFLSFEWQTHLEFIQTLNIGIFVFHKIYLSSTEVFYIRVTYTIYVTHWKANYKIL